MKKIKGKKIFGIISALVAVTLGTAIYTYASQQVKIQISQTPNVDVVLTKSQTEYDFTNFEDNLKQELINQKVMSQEEIDSGKLNISAVDTQTTETQEIFNWQRSVSASIGSVGFSNNGKNVSMLGNPSNAGKNAIWIIPEGNQEQHFNFGYSIDFGDSFNAAGMLLRVRKNTNGTLEGYMLSFNNRGAFVTGSYGALWYFKYNHVNTSPFVKGTDITLISNLNISRSGTLDVQVTDTNIIINGGGLSSEFKYEFKSGESYGEGYGFFSDHYSHGCSNIGQFSLTNINLQTQTVKKFTEVLQAPEWRYGSLRILINAEDNENEQFSNNDELTAIIAKLMNNDVYYIGWGTEENREQMEDVIKKNDGKGIYVGNSSENAVNETVKYIKKVIKNKVGNTIIAGEPVNVKVTSPSTGVETPTPEYPNGVWKVVHDDQYYENSQNQYELSGIYTNELITSFDNVGKYYIYCENKLVTEVYAHRRPVSSFNMNMAGNKITLESTSYDLDIEVDTENTTMQKANNGIKTEKWEYKKVKDENSSWVKINSEGIGNSIEKTLEENTEYMIRLTVEDYQGVQTTAIKYVTTGKSTLKPVASYKVKNKTISVYEKLEVIDESYDPSGEELTYTWTVKKGNTQVYKGNTPLLDFSTNVNSSYGIGNYKMSLVVSKVVNGITISSEEFSQNIEVVKDITPPSIIVDPIEAETQNEEISVNVNIKDDESGVKSYKYAFTQDVEEVVEENWSEEIIVTGNIVEESIKLSRDYTDQILYLHVKATNQEGAESKEKVTGPYYINPYILELQAFDSDSGVAVDGAVYDIIGEKQNGQLVEIIKNATTDSNGKIYVEKAKLKDVTSIKIENKEKAVGYELADYRTIRIDTTDSKIVVDKSESSNDVRTQVSEDGQTIKIQVPVDRIKFNLEIINIDAQTKNLLSGTDFTLKQNNIIIAEGITADGKLTLNVPSAGKNTTQEYVLEQTNINNQYTDIGKIYLKITFNENAEVAKVAQKLFVENKSVTIEDNTKAYLIIENDRKETSKFEAHIHVTDYTESTAVTNTKYKVKVETADGLEYTTPTYISNDNGDVIVENLYGTGLLKLTFIHEEAASGYQKETVNRYITIDRNLNGNITYNQASMSGVFDKIENGNVYVNLTNVKKSSTNAIKLKIVSEENTNVPMEGIGVEIYKILDKSLVGSGTTDENGCVEITNVKNDGEGEVLYRVEFENDVLGISPVIVIKFQNNKISNAYQMSNIDGVNAFYTEDNDDDMFKYVANIQINGTMQNAETDNTLTIKQYDEETQNSVVGAQYKVKMSINDSITTKVITTDNKGEATTDLLQDKNLTIQITQTKASSGYSLDTMTKIIVLTKNSNGIYKVSSTKNIDVSKIQIDEEGNIVVEEFVSSSKYSKVKVQIAKTDENNKLSLGGFKFKITESTTGYKQEVTTNSNGYITVGEKFVATEGKSYIFEIEELQTIQPYKLLEEPIKVEVRFTKNGDVVTYSGVNCLQGNNSLAEQQVKYDEEQNELTISLKIMNIANEITDGILYNLDLIKVNSDGEKVSGSKYDIEVRPYAESSIISSNTIISDEIEVKNLAIKEDKTTILLKEINAAIGYGIDEEIKVITLRIDENGNLIYDLDTTTKDLKIEIVKEETEGELKTIVKITVYTKDATEVEQPEIPNIPDNPDEPNVPDNPDEPNVPEDAEIRPENANVAIKVFNKSYGSWSRQYDVYKRKLPKWWKIYTYYNSSYELQNAQKLERIFKNSSDAQNNGFKFITGSDITVETRLVSDGVVNKEIYETVKARGNTNINDINGTDSIYLYNDYKNKTVEITVIQNVPAYNYKRNTNDIKFIAKFDESGNMKTAEITQGNDTEEFAIGGVSAQGIVDNIKYLTQVEYKLHYSGYVYSVSEEYEEGEINKYNSIGSDTIYLGLLNKAISNPLSIKVNLKDIDTDEKLNGEVSVIVSEKIAEDEYKAISYQVLNIANGTGIIKLDNTYANRTLRIEIAQISNARNGNIQYKNEATITTQFEITFNDDADIQNLNQITISDNVTYEGFGGNQVEYTIYNTIIYNFAINLTKLDENGQPLEGVRVQTQSYYMNNVTTEQGVQICTYGSKATDKNGNTKLKVVLPESGIYKYYGKTIDIVLNEYYVPDNYTAIQGIRIRILFNNNGTVKECKVISDYNENNTVVLDVNKIEEGAIESSSVNIQMKNKLVEEKPIIQITDMDSEDNTIKLNDAKYKISVWDEEEYAKDNLAINEIRYSRPTSEDGLTTVYFENAHALRTIIYKIEEIQSANSYATNKPILVRAVYDKDGKISKMPEILSEQTINIPNKGLQFVVSVEGNPVGSTLLKLNIINELKPSFTIKINKSRLKDYKIYNGNVFKAISQVKNEDGTYSETVEERISNEMYYNNTEIGFKQKYKNQTILYTIFEQTGNTYTQRGKVEVTFDEYGNVLNQTTEGRYITNTTFVQNTNYINTYVQVGDFNIGINVESTNKEASYSLAGYTFDITNSKGESSTGKTKTNNLGNVVELIGEVYKGETITYYISQGLNAIDYEPIEDIELTVTFDESGNITSCTPTSKEGIYDLVTTVKNIDNNANMEIKMYVKPSERTIINVNLKDDSDDDKVIQNAMYDLKISTNENVNYSFSVTDGIGDIDVGSCQKYKNETIVYTLNQTEIDEKYMINENDIQVSVTYNSKGIITDARIIASDGYVQVDENSTIGSTQLYLITKNREKVKMQVYNISNEDNTDELEGSSFKIIQAGKSDLYSDTKTTSSNGRAQLYVGPYYVDEEVPYKITNTVHAFGFDKVEEIEFTLKYNEKGKIIGYNIPSEAQEYLSIEIPNKKSEYYDITDIIITVKSKPLFTLGVETVDETSKKPLVGGKYQVRELNNSANKGTVITKTDSVAHACIGETKPGETVIYEIVELQAPLGYKHKDINNVIGTIQVKYNGEGKIVKEETTILSGYNYIFLKQETDKPDTYDVDIQIEYEEIEEFKVVIENQNVLDNADKIKSNFYGQLSTGIYKETTTDKDTGIGMMNFGKITAINSKQILTISQSQIEGSYMAIANIKISINFDENGKVKDISSISGPNYATENVSYVIEQTGTYTIKITIKNNPVTKFNIKNISDGDETLTVNSTYELSGIGINGTKEIITQKGEASAILETVPKSTSISYTLKQTKVDKGYELNKNIVIKVTYDSDGKITNVHQIVSTSTADVTVIKSITFDNYQVNIEIKNKQKFEIYITAQDSYDESIKIANAQIYLKENSYSLKSINLETNSQGEIDTVLGATIANSYLDYELRLLNIPTGYDSTIKDTIYSFRVYFGSNGNVVNCVSNSSLIDVSYGSGLAIEVKVKYIPNLTMEIERTNTSTNTTLSGRTLSISSSALIRDINTTTNSQGKINISAGRITASNTVTYTISEKTLATDTNMEILPIIVVNVVYDNLGNISEITTNNPDYVTTKITGRRSLQIILGTEKITTMSIIASDYYNHTVNVTGNYEITSNKADKFSISSTIDTTYVIAKLGKVYPGEKIEYVIHQTNGQRGYEIVEDQIFYVEYALDGTIKDVQTANSDRLIVNKVTQNNSKIEPNIILQLYVKSTLEISLKVEDKQYNTGVYGLGFKVKNEDTGIETIVDAKTNENGEVKISVPPTYENKNINYTITQTNTIGGYKMLNPIKLVVAYGNLGTINEEGTYIINPQTEKITQGYSKKIYQSSRIKGVQIEIEAETEMGIGIEKQDVYGNKLTGVEYIITAKEDNNINNRKVITDTNGETTTYIGAMPKNKVVEYTISEIEAPRGFRKIEDAIIKIYYNSEGRIVSYSIEQQPENVIIEIATDDLCKMTNSKESVHLKLKIINDNRVTFRVVNKDSGIEETIKDAEFSLSVEGEDGTIKSETLKTDKKGQVSLENIQANGEITFYFNQLSVPSNYLLNANNSGYIKIDKSSNEYKLTYLSGSNNLNYTIDNETGIVTIYLKNDNNLILNIIDIDGETGNTADNASHTVKVQYGDVNQELNEILGRTDNILLEKGPENSVNAITTFNLGNTYQLFNKKVVYTISTPITPDLLNEKYNAIKEQYIVAVFDENGFIETVNGETTRLENVNNINKLTINANIVFGNIDNYKIKIVKHAQDNYTRLNNAVFNIKLNVEGTDVENYEQLQTNSKIVNGLIVEEGIIEISKLKYEGNMKISLTELAAPEGYEKLAETQIDIGLNVHINKIDVDEVKLEVSNQSCNSANANIQVDEQAREIVINITNKSVIKLAIDKRDEEGNSLSGMKFNLKVQEIEVLNEIMDYGTITTTEEGIAQVFVENKYFGKTIFITLTEEKNEYYKEIAPITIKAVINTEGQITETNIISGKDSSSISNTQSIISIKIVNKLEEYIKPYEIEIVKTNENDTNLIIPEVLFQVKVTPDVGIPVYKAVITDDNGQINLKGLVGSGNIIIELREIEAPSGYELGETEGYYRYEIKKENDVLQIISSNVQEELVDIDNQNKVIKIKVPNGTDSKGIGLAINKIDESDYDLNIGNTTFSLVDNESGEKYTITTDNKGIAYVSLPKVIGTTKNYTLTETVASNGYMLDSTPKNIQIVYDENGNISNVSEEDGLEILEKNTNYVKYAFTNKQETLSILPYNVKVINIDKNSKAVIENSEFNIKVNQTVGATALEATKKTDANGIISLNINGAGEIKINLKNTKAANGYQVNNNEMYITMNRNEISGNISIQEAENITAQYDESNNTIIIYVESQIEVNLYSMKFNIVDKTTNETIQDKNVKLNITFNGETRSLNVNDEGKIFMQGLQIPDLNKFEITIEDLQNPNGYNKIETSQKIIAYVTKVYDSRVIYKLEVQQGDNIQIVSSTDNSMNVNILYEKLDVSDDELYLISDVYRVSDSYVERISGPRTVKEYLANMKSNGEMTVYDKQGNILDDNSYVGTGMKIVSTKGEQQITKELSVIGDVTGDGLIKALDISLMKQHLVGKKKLEGAYLLAGDINDDGEIKALDISKEKQAIVGKITL